MSPTSPPGGETDARAAAIEEAVLRRIRPDAALLNRVALAREHLVRRASEEAQRRGLPLVRALVAGSGARGTFLNDRLDLDLFFLFPPELPRSELEAHGLALGAALLSETETRYAEHPYLRGKFEGFNVDAVPGYAVAESSRPQTAVDRTPFHQDYLARHQSPELVDQVRLTKQFLRALSAYGSEARTGGFSGYLVELLVLRFGGFRPLLTAARGWRVPVRLTTTPGAGPRVPDDVALVLDDPVDPNRNVATALSRKNLGLFILAADAYLSAPSARAFNLPAEVVIPLPEALRRVAERGTEVTVLVLPRPKVVDDILYPQLRKAERALAEEAERLGFQVVGTAAAAGAERLLTLLETSTDRLPGVRVQDGPPPGVDRVGSFLGKWTQEPDRVLQGPYVTRDGRLAVETRRAERSLVGLLAAALPHLPVGRDVRAEMGSSARLTPLNEEPDSPELGRALGELLGKRLPWLGAPDARPSGRKDVQQ